MRMTRIWMTGCMALVLLAAGRWPVRDESDTDERGHGARITLTSKYDLDETVRQVERSARKSGLPVVARTVPRSPGAEADAADATHVLVLGDQGGLTPVMQANGGMSPELPWQVMIRQHPDGYTEVSLPNPEAMTMPEELEPGTLEKVAAWPAMLKSVIT